MNYTENLTLGLPEYGEDADVADLNRNSGILDAYCYNTRQMECEPYDSTKTYMSGDLSIHNEVIYECNTDNTTGAWDDSKWDSTTLAEQIAKAKQSGGESALADLEDVNITNPSEGQILTYDDANDEWVNTDMPDTAVTKEATGNPIELTDAASAPMVKCVSEIQGSQDLHGYDKPWVGGAGKNKLPMVLADIKNTQSPATSQGSWSGDSYVTNGVTFKINTDNAGNVTSILATGSTTNDNATLVLYGTNVTSEKDIVFSQPFIVSDGANGSATTFRGIVWGTEGTFIDGEEVSFNAMTIYGFGIRIMAGYTLPSGGVMFYPMIRLSTVTDSTFAPYSNICPITAYTEGEIEVRGKNIFDSTNLINDRSIDFDGDVSGYGGRVATPDYISVPSNSSICLTYSKTVSQNVTFIYALYNNGTMISRVAGNSSGTVISTGNANQVRFAFYDSVSISDLYNIQLEKGTSPTTFEQFTSTTHTTTYPSAIYRGSEDVVKGEVTSDMLCDDLGDFTWTKASGFSNKDVFYTPLSSLSGVPKHVIYQVPNAISSVAIATYQQAPVWEIGTFVFVGIEGVLPANTLGFIVPLGAYSDATAFKTAMTGQKIAYEIATPTTSSVTPTNLPVKSLNGYSHIESSTGEMEVEYITEEYQPLVDLIQSSKHVYSTQEQIVGTWIDGRDLYERIIEFPNVTINGGPSDFKYKGDLMIKSIIPNADIILPDLQHSYYVVNSAQFSFLGFRVNCNTGELTVVTMFTVTNADLHIYLQYTKTPSSTRSLNAPVTSQKAQIEPLIAEEEEVPTEEEKAVNEEENNDETR